ncbi:hypothetical protein Gpo141_00006879 [Globisporangium polare]
MQTNRCVACLLVTTTGRILVQWELDATLPLRYPQLGLLIASLVQFSNTQPFAQLELNNGFTLIACSDAISQLSSVVVCKTPLVSESKSSHYHRSLDMAHLKSLVILNEFLRCYRDLVDEIVVESRAASEHMVEKYTLTSALGGGRGAYGDDGDAASDGTMDAFAAFQNEFIAPMMEDDSTENIRTGISDSVARTSASAIDITRQFVMDADSGRMLYALMAAPKLSNQHRYLEERLQTQQLLRRVAQALSRCFPILQQTSLLARNQEDSHVGFSNSSFVSSTTVVLRIGGGDAQKEPAPSSTGVLHIAVQMLGAGTFASVVFFYGVNDRFLGHSSQLVRSGDLQRVLIADPRGGHLLGLVQEGVLAADFQLHVGSDGAPESVLQALENVTAPWTKNFLHPSVPPSRSASLVR